MNKRNAPAENQENAPRERQPEMTKGLLDTLRNAIDANPRDSVAKLGTLLSDKLAAMRGVDAKDAREQEILAAETGLVDRRLNLVQSMA